MRVVQRPRALVDDLDHVVDPQQVVRAAIRRQRACAVDMLRDDVAVVALFACVEDRQDVGMLQHAHHVGFGQEHLPCDARLVLVAARVKVVDLDRDVAAIERVVREVHRAGAASTHFVDDHVLADLFGDRAAGTRRGLRGSNHPGREYALPDGQAVTQVPAGLQCGKWSKPRCAKRSGTPARRSSTPWPGCSRPMRCATKPEALRSASQAARRPGGTAKQSS